MYSENQVIQKKRDNVQTSALEWTINHLKTLQNNIARINNWIEGQTIKELTFELTFNDYYNTITPDYLAGDEIAGGGYSSYKTDSLQTSTSNQAMTIYPFVSVFSNNITQTIASASDVSKLTNRPVSLTYFNNSDDVVVGDSRELFPIMTATASALANDGNKWIAFVVNIPHGDFNPDLFSAGSNLILILEFTSTNQTNVFEIFAHENGFAYTLNSYSSMQGFNFFGKVIRFVYRYI